MPVDPTLPHAVYRVFDRDGVLIYVGCALAPFRRAQHHLYTQPWGNRVARVDIEWCGDWLAARRREMEVVAADHPLHNKMIYEPAAVGTSQHDGPPRGDGLTCPTCGLPKESRKHAYCRSCTSAYQRERRIAKGWVPKRRSQSVVCPRCRGPKSGARAYCSECKRQVSQEARDRGRV